MVFQQLRENSNAFLHKWQKICKFARQKWQKNLIELGNPIRFKLVSARLSRATLQHFVSKTIKLLSGEACGLFSLSCDANIILQKLWRVFGVAFLTDGLDFGKEVSRWLLEEFLSCLKWLALQVYAKRTAFKKRGKPEERKNFSESGNTFAKLFCFLLF